VASSEHVVYAFLPAEVAAQTAFFPDRGETISAAREDLVDITLVTHVPDQFVMRGVKNAVKRNRQFDSAQTRREMPAVLGDNIEYQVSDLARKLR
jgi:hypothetical protein